jgi:hypothetical protein
MDTVPALVVYLSLVALSKNPKPWEALNNEDNLLFTEPDFSAPYRTDVWRHLDELGNGEVRALAGQLRQACDPSWLATGGLESLLTTPGGRPWWEQVGASSTTGTSVKPPPAVKAGTSLPPPPRTTTVPPKVSAPKPSSRPKWDPKKAPTVPAAGQKPGVWWGTPSQTPNPVPGTPAVGNQLGRDAGISFGAFVGVTAGASSAMGYSGLNFVALLIGVAAAVVLFIILRIVHDARS